MVSTLSDSPPRPARPLVSATLRSLNLRSFLLMRSVTWSTHAYMLSLRFRRAIKMSAKRRNGTVDATGAAKDLGLRDMMQH